MNNTEDQIISNIDTTLVHIKNRIRNMKHNNPYTNKTVTRMCKNKLQECEILSNYCQNKINNEEDEDKMKEYVKLMREIKECTNPIQTIDEQLSDLTPDKNSKGINSFDWDIDYEDTFINQYTLIIAPSKSGKSFLINQLIYEIPHSFDKVIFFMGKVSYKNKCPQVLKHVCNLAGIKTQWINTDSEKKPEWSKSEQQCFENLNDDGSSKYIYDDTTNPTIMILDDLYSKPSSHWTVNFLDSLACMGRHRKTSCFVAFQGFSRLSNKIVDNASKIFLYYQILDREDLFRKLKIMPPTNLNEVLDDIKKGLNSRWYYLDDDRLEEYIPFNIVSKQQALSKMRSKLPKSILDEKKKKELEEMNKRRIELENELNISPIEDQTIQKKPTKIELIDIKDAKKVDSKDYNKTFQEGEHQFIYKGKHKGLRAKYNL